MTNGSVLSETRLNARSLNDVKDLAPLIDRISDARIVMLGEATHGTHEFYEWRRLITEWLVVKQGFNIIAVEGDFPDLLPLNRYVTRGEGSDARSVLQGMHRWPTWLWSNVETARLGEWLRTHNQHLPRERWVQISGLDVYSLFDSVNFVLKYLERSHPFLARRMRTLYSCFDRFHGDEVAYVRSLSRFPEGCRREVLQALECLLRLRLNHGPRGDASDDAHEDLLDAQQGARIVHNAEAYYRAMIEGGERSWNVRDQHMMDTLDILLQRRGPDGRAIVWAHNSHIGDFRATEMQSEGLINLGALARQRHGHERIALVGFSTYRGNLTASDAWDGPIERMQLPPARPGSWEEIFHIVADEMPHRSLFLTFDRMTRSGPLSNVLGHRAIGVVYDPKHERWSNYVPSALGKRYDAMIHLDETSALEPLVLPFDSGQVPETWPAGQ